MTFADKAIAYYESLDVPIGLAPGVSALNPYQNLAVQPLVRQFYQTFFGDDRPRVFVLGINPGRFGAGVTGISFTTPQNLARYCGIENNLPPTPELSSRFVYRVIEEMGGAATFYSRFFLTSLYPLALVKDRKNYNFYDDKATTAALWPVMTESVRTQLAFGADQRVAFCLGQKNATFLRRLNDEQSFFGRIEVLDHPRYILQYRAKLLDEYVERYVQALGAWL